MLWKILISPVGSSANGAVPRMTHALKPRLTKTEDFGWEIQRVTGKDRMAEFRIV